MWDPTDRAAPDDIEPPTVASLSDVHGYLDAFQSALTAVGEADEHPPIVSTDPDGQVHWADNNYVLVLNGDVIDVSAVNDATAAAATAVLETPEEEDTEATQRDIARRHHTVFGLGGAYGRGAEAGLLWMNFTHMHADAPPQIVGHSRHERPTQNGRVVCENVIRSNRDSPGGESVLLETPDSLSAVIRTPDGITTRDFQPPTSSSA